MSDPTPAADAIASLILVELDLSGPLPFSALFTLAQAAAPDRAGIHPATLHDLLNNLLADGTLQLAPSGLYLHTS